MWKMRVVFGVALALACGPEHSQHRRDREGDVGGFAGAAGGGSEDLGGMGAAAGLSPGPICPEMAPEAESECDSTALNCRYEVCDDDTSKMFSCRGGRWQLTRACGPLECPTERPPFLSDCAPLEGLACSYEEDCCGGEPVRQNVVARCEYSQWTFAAPPEQSCSFCQVRHETGAACDLAPECARTGCYSTSCYGQPLVEECVDGVWLSQTLCSK